VAGTGNLSAPRAVLDVDEDVLHRAVTDTITVSVLAPGFMQRGSDDIEIG
jgi:hypothetical protein